MSLPRPIAATALAVATVVAVAGCASASAEEESKGEEKGQQTITVEFEHNVAGEDEEPRMETEEVEVPFQPKKVVVFDMATLDTLGTLGVDIAGAPLDSVPDYLKEHVSKDTVNAGSLFEPDLTAVEAAQPDLIVVAGRSSAAWADLNEIAPTVDLTLDPAEYMDGFEHNVEVLGEIFGKEKEAEQAFAEVEASFDELAGKIEKTGQNGLITMVSGGKLSIFGSAQNAEGRTGRFGVVHDVLGVRPAIEDVQAANHGEPVSFEFLLEHDPDWLIVIDREAVAGDGSGQPAEQILDNEIVHQTSAWQNDRVVYLDPAAWYIVGSGLTTAGVIADDLAPLAGA